MILDALRWLAAADAVAAVLLAATVYRIGRRSPGPITTGRAIGLAVLLSSPAADLKGAVWLFGRLH